MAPGMSGAAADGAGRGALTSVTMDLACKASSNGTVTVGTSASRCAGRFAARACARPAAQRFGQRCRLGLQVGRTARADDRGPGRADGGPQLRSAPRVDFLRHSHLSPSHPGPKGMNVALCTIECAECHIHRGRADSGHHSARDQAPRSTPATPDQPVKEINRPIGGLGVSSLSNCMLSQRRWRAHCRPRSAGRPAGRRRSAGRSPARGASPAGSGWPGPRTAARSAAMYRRSP